MEIAMKKDATNKARNFVHKHGVEFNHSKVFDDRKKKHKNGYKKHKGGNNSAPFDFGTIISGSASNK